VALLISVSQSQGTDISVHCIPFHSSGHSSQSLSWYPPGHMLL
jgi:hypothetical protein